MKIADAADTVQYTQALRLYVLNSGWLAILLRLAE